jgi:hypothetical protein
VSPLERAAWGAVAELALRQEEDPAPSTERAIRELVNALAPMPAWMQEPGRAPDIVPGEVVNVPAAAPRWEMAG